MAITSYRTHRAGKRRKNEMNVVPYIDVMLVLLVIFMVTAPMITPGLVNLPSVGQATEVPATPVEIQIDQNGNVSVRLRSNGNDFKEIDKDQVVQEVQHLITQPNTPVILAADGKVAYEEVVKIMDVLRSNGITRLGLLVNQRAQQSAKK